MRHKSIEGASSSLWILESLRGEQESVIPATAKVPAILSRVTIIIIYKDLEDDHLQTYAILIIRTNK